MLREIVGDPAIRLRVPDVGLGLIERVEPEVHGATDQVAAARIEGPREPVEPLDDPVVELDENLFPGHGAKNSIWSSIWLVVPQ